MTTQQALTYLRAWVAESGFQIPQLLAGDWQETVEQLPAYLRSDKTLTCEILALTPEGRSYSIAQLRKIFRTISVKVPTGRRLIILPEADRLSEAASHTLLKQLEEAGERNRWLLTTAFPQRLLPTIRSRTQVIRVAEGEAPVPAREWDTAAAQEWLTYIGKDSLSDEKLDSLGVWLVMQVAKAGIPEQYFATLLRLRDYYKIRALTGNSKLPKDVLFGTLAALKKPGNF